jgi:hypothetical protein
MLVLWILAKVGLYIEVAQMMAQWHVLFNLTFLGLIGGMIEAAIVSFIAVYSFVFIYNLVNSR